MLNQQKVNLLAVGDISLNSCKQGNPFNQNILSLFKSKDVLFGNLETVLSEENEQSEKAVLLYANPREIKYLVDAGFDVLNLANNHAFDLGIKGFNQTIEALRRTNISIVGLGEGNFTSFEKNGITFGFLGYSETSVTIEGKIIIPPIDENLILSQISEAKNKCDHLIISLHWGTENVFYPSPKQVILAHKIIDAGVSLVLGHHSHTFQPVERYGKGVIVYSLGNFQFRHVGDINTKISAVLSVLLSKKGIDSFEILPTQIEDDYSVSLVINSEKNKYIQELQSISDIFEANKLNHKFWFEQIASEYLSGNLKAWKIRIRKYGFIHLLQCLKWLVSPFVIKCYLGIARKLLKGSSKY